MKKNVFALMFILLLYGHTLTAESKMPDKTERVYSLSLIRCELKCNFAFPEILQRVNIDSLYRVYLPIVEQAESAYEYYQVLSSFLAHFDDAHTRVSDFPLEMESDNLPLSLGSFDKKILVTNIPKSLSDTLPIGSEIVKIDHIPVRDYLEDSVYPYLSSFYKDSKYNMAVPRIGLGKEQSTVILTVKMPDGLEKKIEIKRNRKSYSKEEWTKDSSSSWKPIWIKITNENIGYIQLNSFNEKYGNIINTVFNDSLPQLQKCKGLIIDLRGNSGGYFDNLKNIMEHLILKPGWMYKGKVLMRRSSTDCRQNSLCENCCIDTKMREMDMPRLNTAKVRDSLKLRQPLVILSGLGTGSAAELFLMGMKDSGRVMVIGQASAGALGQSKTLVLPGDIRVTIGISKYINADGKDRIRILPDIEVVKEFGRDNVLRRALDELQTQVK